MYWVQKNIIACPGTQVSRIVQGSQWPILVPKYRYSAGNSMTCPGIRVSKQFPSPESKYQDRRLYEARNYKCQHYCTFIIYWCEIITGFLSVCFLREWNSISFVERLYDLQRKLNFFHEHDSHCTTSFLSGSPCIACVPLVWPCIPITKICCSCGIVILSNCSKHFCDLHG